MSKTSKQIRVCVHSLPQFVNRLVMLGHIFVDAADAIFQFGEAVIGGG